MGLIDCLKKRIASIFAPAPAPAPAAVAEETVEDNPIVDSASHGNVTIARRKNGHIDVDGGEYPNTKAALKDVASKAGIEIDEKWNTQYMGWFIIQKLNGTD